MKKIAVLLVFTVLCCQSVASEFSFHLMKEPHSLDPIRVRGAAGSYLFSNIHRSLFRYRTKQGLIPEGAKRCTWLSSLELTCELNKNIKWSNGQDVVANDYVRAFRRIVAPETKTTHSKLFLNIKNVKKILKNKLAASKLGVEAVSSSKLKFIFTSPDPEFTYKLTYPSLAPVFQNNFPSREDAKKLIVNGPYKIKKWTPGRKIILTRNPHYPNPNKSYPDILVHIINDDNTALRVYESKKMNFLRRLTTSNIPKYEKEQVFFQTPVARFDYIGFGPELAKHKNIRKALALSLQYKDLKKIYKALGLPGCPSMPRRLMDKVHCHNYQPDLAKAELENITKDLQNRRWPIHFSKMGGDDIAKGMEWVQHQWSKHLNLKFDLEPVEQGMYIRTLRSKVPPVIFRKGIGMNRPTCLAGLEVFTPGHPENYIQLNDPKYNAIVKSLKKAKGESAKRKFCSKGIKHLLGEYYLIPLGEMYFTMLEDQKFEDWSVNELNQLDLTKIKVIK